MLREFLRHLPPLPLPAEMRAWDAAASKLGLPEIVLMENAARAALAVMQEEFAPLAGKRVWLFMGSGNNGGDAACLARHLLDAGAIPLVFHSRPLRSCRGACGRHVRLARALGVSFLPLARLAPLVASPASRPDILVDGLLGTGFAGPLRPDLCDAVSRLNELGQHAPILSLDIPSGLDGLTGKPSPLAVQARHTVSFAAAKPGLLHPTTRYWTGTLHVRDIGIPLAIRATSPCSAHLLDGHCLRALPMLPKDGHKYTYGHVLVVGGASGMGGAAHLAARAALRCGAGLVTAAASATALADIRGASPEIITIALPTAQGQPWPTDIPATLESALGRASALVLGPGMGRQGGEALLAALLARENRPPAVLDADALRLLAQNPQLLPLLREQDVLTPHPGEAAALLGCGSSAIQSARLTALHELCQLSKAAVILKGAGSLVGQAGQPWLLSPYDLPPLAVAGSGDVLAGCVGALLGRRGQWGGASLPSSSKNRAAPDATPPALVAAALGVALHALAGLKLGSKCPRGHLASELADCLPHAWASYATAPAKFQEVLPWPACN